MMRRAVAAAALALSAQGRVRDACDVKEAVREDCSQMNEHTCLQNGCCWQPVDPNPQNRPWCFKQGSGPSPPSPPTPAPPSPEQCSVDNDDKVDCLNSSPETCASAGCCWKEAGEGSSTPWCFYKKGDRTISHCTLKGEPKEPFSESEVAEVRKLFAANLDIQGSGLVVAAPDHNTGPGGDYYFAWMRDGALSMHALLDTFEYSDDVKSKMQHWLNWVEKSETQQPHEGRDVMTEPKFVIPSGVPFPGGWCRPQTDGPGLRALTLLAYSEREPSMSDRIWTSAKRELDWVAANYTHPGCDLWEEVQSTDFFWNRYTMRRALIRGARYAEKVKDHSRHAAYTEASNAISEKLAAHIDDNKFVFESENRKRDTAVIHAFNTGDEGDGFFGALSDEVIKTQVDLSSMFCRSYGLNQQAAKAGISGILYGRYEGDHYDGGNPWVLLTATVAQLLYRQSEAMAHGGAVQPGAQVELEKLLGQEVNAQNLLAAGDAIMNRMRTFLTNGMHMNEQINRDSGGLTSAKDLTWNYANILQAMKARKAAVKKAEIFV